MAQLTPNIIVNDVNKTVLYYIENLNFEFIMGVDSDKESCTECDKGKLIWAMLTHNGAELMFQHADSIAEELPQFQKSTTGDSLTLYFRIENVVPFYEEIKENVDVVKSPYKTFYGSNEFVIRDLNGLFLYFAEVPHE